MTREAGWRLAVAFNTRLEISYKCRGAVYKIVIVCPDGQMVYRLQSLGSLVRFLSPTDVEIFKLDFR